MLQTAADGKVKRRVGVCQSNVKRYIIQFARLRIYPRLTMFAFRTNVHSDYTYRNLLISKWEGIENCTLFSSRNCGMNYCSNLKARLAGMKVKTLKICGISNWMWKPSVQKFSKSVLKEQRHGSSVAQPEWCREAMAPGNKLAKIIRWRLIWIPTVRK